MTSGKLVPSRNLFVVMPFGVRNASPEHPGNLIDFDKVHSQIIRPAAEEADWKVVRIDEVVRPGPISDHYLKEIYTADLVLADVSIQNANVFYELGIRHAISTGGTVLIALRNTRLPFDIAHLRVLFYEIDEQGIQDAKSSLVRVLREYHLRQTPAINPIREFLERLGATSSPTSGEAAFEQELHGRISRARNVDQLIAIWRWAQNLAPLPALALLALADRLADHEAWQTSVEVLRRASVARPKDFEIHRQLGWHLRHLGPGFELEAIASLERALELNPGDPESIGMLAGILKRRKDYEKAAKLYDRGAQLSPESLYMRVNQAAMTIMTEAGASERGISLYHKLYTEISQDPQRQSDAWAELVLGEAAFAIGDVETAEQHFSRASTLIHSPKDLRSAADQIEILGNKGFRTDEARLLSGFLRKLAAPERTTLRLAAVKAEKTATGAPVIVHLSDLHFGTMEMDGKRTVMHRFFDGEYEKELSTHIVAEFASRHSHFDHRSERLYLVVSGDLTYTAGRNEFRQAREFLDEVCLGLGVSKDRVLIVPGNHDVHWPSTRVDRSHHFDNYLGFIQDFYGEELFRKRYPRVTWDFHVNSERPSPGDIVAIDHHRDLTIVGLNSCVYETDQNHYGFVGGRQLETATDLIEEAGGTINDIRIAVLHHHLHPFPEPIIRSEDQIWMDLSTIRDAGLVERRLERLGFDIVLHGHKHKAQLRETLVHERDEPRKDNPRLIVCGAGSAGVNGKELEHNYSNHYEVIEILRCPRAVGADFLSIEWRELALVPCSEWVTNQRWVVMG